MDAVNLEDRGSSSRGGSWPQPWLWGQRFTGRRESDGHRRDSEGRSSLAGSERELMSLA